MTDGKRLKGLAVFLAALTALLFLTTEPRAASGPDAFRFVVYADSRGGWTQGAEINRACHEAPA